MLSLADAGATGDHVEVLAALLASLTEDYASTADVRTKAALAAQIRGTSTELKAARSAVSASTIEAGDPIDELARRRVERGAGPAPSEGRALRSR